MKEDYLQHLLDMEKLLSDFRNEVTTSFFTDREGSMKNRVDSSEYYFCFHPSYRGCFDIIKRIVQVCDIFGIKYLEKEKEILDKCVYLLEVPVNVKRKVGFDACLEEVEKRFRYIKNEAKERISLLNPAEMDRLNEAIHCFLEGCYYSAVAMSVSAIEFRLFSLMMSVCPDPKLEELTLGQLIREYLEDKQKYGNVIPKKHEPLLEHCNTYRIFSVHPKKEEINKPIASSILNLTFLFLLDKKLIKKVKEVEAI